MVYGENTPESRKRDIMNINSVDSIRNVLLAIGLFLMGFLTVVGLLIGGCTSKPNTPYPDLDGSWSRVDDGQIRTLTVQGILFTYNMSMVHPETNALMEAVATGDIDVFRNKMKLLVLSKQGDTDFFEIPNAMLFTFFVENNVLTIFENTYGVVYIKKEQ